MPKTGCNEKSNYSIPVWQAKLFLASTREDYFKLFVTRVGYQRNQVFLRIFFHEIVVTEIIWGYKQLKFYIHQECIILSHKTGRTIFLVQRKTCFNGYIFCLSTQGMNKIWVCFCWDKLGFNDRVVIQKFDFFQSATNYHYLSRNYIYS